MRARFQIYLVAAAVASLGVPALWAQPAGAPDNSVAPPLGQNPPPSDSRPALPGVGTPLDYFRKLLALKPAERQQALADRSNEYQKYLTAKLQEWDALSEQEREFRLQAAQLYWHWSQLFNLNEDIRAERLKLIPPPERLLVQERLRQWDLLSETERQEFLKHEKSLMEMIKSPVATVNADWLKLETTVSRWRNLPEERRERMLQYFKEFFTLPEKEKARTLKELPDRERREMEGTLKAFERLPPAQRENCLRSFRQLSNMTPSEREQFLANAALWKSMSGTERQTWRGLVNKLPPLPPGLAEKFEPPLPDGFPSTPNRPAINPAGR